MTTPQFHVQAACLDGSGSSCRRIGLDDAVAMIRARQGLVWLNLEGEDDAQARQLLQDRLGFHELAVEDALSKAERPSLQEYDDVVFFVLTAAISDGKEERFVEVGFYLMEHALVTYAEETLPIVREWFHRWQQRPMSTEDSPARLAHVIADALVDDYFPIVDGIEDAVDDVGDLVFGGDVRQVRNIQLLKRRLLYLRRRLSPIRDVLNGLLRRDLPMVPNSVEPYFQDVLDHTLRLAELVDMNRDTLASLLDVHLSAVSNNINEVMKRMTFISTALMSSALIAGIYGMNFEKMPELHWLFGYPFALLLMAGAYGFVYVYFRRKQWL